MKVQLNIFVQSCLRLSGKLTYIVAWLLKVSLVGLRSLLGPNARCYFYPPCTEFACQQLEQKPLIPALWAIFIRLLSCNPVYFWLKRMRIFLFIQFFFVFLPHAV